MTIGRSHNKDYKYTKIINNNISLNDLIVNKQKDINNKSIDLQVYDFMKKNSESKENINEKTNYQILSKLINNKSIDSRRLLNKNKIINNNKNNNNIIHVSNGKIINLSNLNNFSYTTEKYNCYYENKRTTPNLNQEEKKNKANINKINNNINKKKEKKTKTNNPNININPILFTKKYPKKEINKYPLRINYTSENLNNALESESLIDYINERESEKDNEISSKRNSKNIDKIDLFNSFNNDDHFKIKKKNIYENNKKLDKNNDNSIEINKNKKYFHTERISSNDINNKKSLNKIKKNNNTIHKNYNIFLSGDKNEISNKDKDKKERNMISITTKKNDYKTNHNSLTFNPIQSEKNNSHILKIKTNERLVIKNNVNHNKINSMENNNITEKKNEKTYKISSLVVNEQFYKNNFLQKDINSSDDENILQISMQSLNDSKIMEIANRYITDEENLDKNEIIEILNSKKEKN